ncbi:MAG: ABC transporter permease [Gemmatimonadetes bacterium]|nr:ABC transporter permease [Gemmatimonadota bacterium]
MFEVMRQALRYATRGLRRAPAHTVASVLTLGLGLAAAAGVYAVVDALLLRTPPFPAAERLVIVESERGGTRGKLSALDVRELGEDARTISGIASFRMTWYTANGDAEPVAYRAAMSSHNIFAVLGTPPMLGAGWPASDDGRAQSKAVISERLWRTRYRADPSIVGRTIQLDVHQYEVLGVMPAGVDFPEGADVWRRVPGGDFESRATRTAGAIARMRPGATLADVQRELAALSARYAQAYPETNEGMRFRAIPLRDAWIGPVRPFLGALGAAAALALVLAGINLAHLALVRARRREVESAVRAALGGQWGAVMAAPIAEGVLVGVLGGVVGILGVPLLTRGIEATVPFDRPPWMTIEVNVRVAAVALGLGVVVSVLAGVLGARGVLQRDLLSTLRRGGARGATTRGTGVRGLLSASQVAMGTALGLGAVALLGVVGELRRESLGFDARGVMAVKIDPPWTAYNTVANTAPFYRRVLDDLRRTSGIVAAATNDALPFASQDPSLSVHRQVPVLEGQDAVAAARNPLVNLQVVSPGYFDGMGIPLRAGRDLAPGDTLGSRPVALVSQRAAQLLWPGLEPLGRRVAFGLLDNNYRPAAGGADTATTWFEVIGIVGDVRQDDVRAEPAPDLYVSHEQQFAPETWVVVRTQGHVADAAAVVKAAVQRVDPLQGIFDVMPLAARVERSFWRQRLAGHLVSVLAGLTGILAVVGVYGVAAFAVAGQEREFGVRLAMGAPPRQLFVGVVGDAARTGAVGAVVGVVIALVLLMGLSRATGMTMAPGVVVVVLVGLGGVAVSAGAAVVPAARASRTDAAVTLRAG